MKSRLHKSFVLILFTASVNFVFIAFASLVGGGRLQELGIEHRALIGLAAVVTALLFLNAGEIASMWVRGRERQIFVKRLVGIPEKHILRSLFADFAAAYLFSFVIGLLLAWLLSLTVKNAFSFSLAPLACVTAFFFNAFIEIAFAAIFIRKKIKRIYGEI